MAQVCAGWLVRTRPAYAPAIRAAADVGGQVLNLSEYDLAVLAAIAFHQPVSRDGLKYIFGKEISRDLIGRLAERDLITTGPRDPAAARLIPLSPPKPSLPPSAYSLCVIFRIRNRCKMRGWQGRRMHRIIQTKTKVWHKIGGRHEASRPARTTEGMPLKGYAEEFERKMIVNTMRRYKGNVAR